MDWTYVTFKNLLIGQEKCINFFADKVVQALVNNLPEVKWGEEFHMNYIIEKLLRTSKHENHRDVYARIHKCFFEDQKIH